MVAGFTVATGLAIENGLRLMNEPHPCNSYMDTFIIQHSSFIEIFMIIVTICTIIFTSYIIYKAS